MRGFSSHVYRSMVVPDVKKTEIEPPEISMKGLEWVFKMLEGKLWVCMVERCFWVCVEGGLGYVCGQWSIFSPLYRLHTWGSFTFMVIQIMKLSIQEILRWEQWTQLPPAACEMGWQTPRQMGEAVVDRQTNHIYLTPLFSLTPLLHSPIMLALQLINRLGPKSSPVTTKTAATAHLGYTHLEPCKGSIMVDMI